MNYGSFLRVFIFALGKLSNRKSNETWELVQRGDDPDPPSGVGTVLNLGLY